MSLIPHPSNAPSQQQSQALKTQQAASTRIHVPTGTGDEVFISESTFRLAHRQHQASAAAASNNLSTSAGKKRKREARGDSSVVYGESAYKGPWARYEAHRPDAGNDDVDEEEEVEEVEIVEEDDEENAAQSLIPGRVTSSSADGPAKLPAIDKSGTDYATTSQARETSTFEGTEQYDYQGRTYMHVPQDLGHIDLRREIPPVAERKNYVPKKLVHTFGGGGKNKTGHTAAITQTRFFPDSGHLLLSASADTKILLWDVYHERELLRSYKGHARSVNDVDFAPDGRSFVSASFDRTMKVWDTETGACLNRFGTGATPHVVRVHPERPWEFIAGMGDKKIVQFDTRVGGADGSSNKTASSTPDSTSLTTTSTALSKASDLRNRDALIQEYDHHLGPINTLTFCDQSRRFISTSDDKSIRAWEYNIPVPIKFIAEPHMYPLVRSCPHPSGKYVAFQSADNQILVYSTADKFRQHRKKSFRGHNVAGYAVDVAVSPDGNVVASGDSAGYVCFWDWKTCKMWHKIAVNGDGKAAKGAGGAVVSVAWHPRESSKVVTGGVDGMLKYWD
ncbi:MAG: hypothetical protein M1831_006615 [Alyxoria varia]|nr:MAG: hypothetical protein M1831_006615 [Alyxoria varia]